MLTLRKTIFSLLLLYPIWTHSQDTFRNDVFLMGCDFDITVVADNEAEAQGFIHLAISEIKRIESLISSWSSSSQTSDINRMAGKEPVIVDPELFQLIERCIQISKSTDGAFDISYASIDHIWRFDGSMTKAPNKEEIESSVKCVNYQDIVLNPAQSSVFLKRKGMKLGFGAIGKGYAADKAKELLVSKGVQAGIINASGDMNAWGTQPNGEPWQIAITNPLNKNKVFARLPLKNRSVVTSGNYEKFIVLDGKRYSHIIDPRTGWPCSGLASVTVLAPKAELADGLATSVFVMGIETGLDRINQIPSVDCIIIDDQGGIHKSAHIEIENL